MCKVIGRACEFEGDHSLQAETSCSKVTDTQIYRRTDRHDEANSSF